MGMDIHVSELRAVAQRLFDHMEEIGYQTFNMDHDYYWIIHKDMKYDSYVKPDPNQFGLGQVSDDLDEARGIITRDSEYLLLSHDLGHFAALLSAISDQVDG